MSLRDWHLGIPRRVSILDALVVLRGGDSPADEAPAGLVALGDSAIRILERRVVGGAAREQRECSENSESHGGFSLCSSSYRLSLAEPEHFFDPALRQTRIPSTQANLIPEVSA